VVQSKFLNKSFYKIALDLSSLMGSLAGGGNIGDMLGKATGNDNKTGGGIMDKVKGMFN
jgi:hypothetical protein